MSNFPSFWSPDNVYNPNYVPNLQKAREEGRNAGLSPVYKQKDRHMLLAIDLEKDFMDYKPSTDGTTFSRLAVPGSLNDAVRFCERLIKGTLEEFYTDLLFTFDQHPVHVIHGDSWWRDDKGTPPDVNLPVLVKRVDDKDPVFEATFISGDPNKILYPTLMKKHTFEYAKHLENTNQNNGYIWVFTSHCREGTDGRSLLPAISELLEWACSARKNEVIFLYKGMIAHVDWFGPFRPCMDVPNHPQGGLQRIYLDKIRECDTIEIAGQAYDFCVNAGVRQILEYYKDDKSVLESIKFIEDCTSPIVPNSDVVKDLKNIIKQNNVKMIKHDSKFEVR